MILGYKIVNLDQLLHIKGKEETLEFLKSFSCNMNIDVENFLKYKAVNFSAAGLAKTHLVITSYKNDIVIAGYFSLSGSKSFVISGKNKTISKRLKNRLQRFAVYNAELKQYHIPAPLIGQLGKNSNFKNLISGDELLAMACEKVRNVQTEVGGKFVYLECEDNIKLINFYERNGFVSFGVRALDPDEVGLTSTVLVQLLKYL